MGGRIDCYLDIASFYSYIAFADLMQNMDRLAANGVQVEFHPVLIAGINDLSGNKPPWTLPAKARYLEADSRRAARRVRMPHIALPRDFADMNMTVAPLRVLLYIKANYPRATFVATLRFFFHRFWTPPHVNLTDEARLRATLADATETPDGGRRLFRKDDVQRIMERRVLMKDVLKRATAEAVDKGAFGAPWLVVKNGAGKTDAFFGSDRFAHIYEHLGIYYRDIEVLVPAKI